MNRNSTLPDPQQVGCYALPRNAQVSLNPPSALHPQRWCTSSGPGTRRGNARPANFNTPSRPSLQPRHARADLSAPSWPAQPIAGRTSHQAFPVCRAQEDPVLLLKCVRSAVVGLPEGHTGQPLKRTWVDCPYGEEEITRLQ